MSFKRGELTKSNNKSKLSKEEENAIKTLTLVAYQSLKKPNPQYFKVLLDEVEVLREKIKNAYEYEILKKVAYDANIPISQINCTHCAYSCITQTPIIYRRCICGEDLFENGNCLSFLPETEVSKFIEENCNDLTITKLKDIVRVLNLSVKQFFELDINDERFGLFKSIIIIEKSFNKKSINLEKGEK